MQTNIDTDNGRIRLSDQGRGQPLLAAFPPLPAVLSNAVARDWLQHGRLVRVYLPKNPSGSVLRDCIVTLGLNDVVVLVPTDAGDLVRALFHLAPKRIGAIYWVDRAPRWQDRWLRLFRRPRGTGALPVLPDLPGPIPSKRFRQQEDGTLDRGLQERLPAQ